MIYLDNAATTKIRPQVLEAMLPYLSEEYGNPSSLYPLGKSASDAITQARNSIATELNAQTNELFFTSGGSESDNWALKGAALAYKDRGKHLVISEIEHHAILHTAEYLESLGFEVTKVPVDDTGIVSPDALRAALREDTILVSIMYASNEIGTIEPIAKLASIAHENGSLFHTDAVQAFGHEHIDVKELGIDLLSASAHKINGPKGVGLLYVRRKTKIHNLIHGGGQEAAKRAGTENVAGIAGFARALEIMAANRNQEQTHQQTLRDYAIKRILNEIPHTRLNGHPIQRLANNLNISFDFIEGESLLLHLAAFGICASSGSACTSGSLDPSHVLLAIGLPHEVAHGSLRLTLGHETTREEIDFVCDKLTEIVRNLREMSPLWEDYLRKEQKDD